MIASWRVQFGRPELVGYGQHNRSDDGLGNLAGDTQRTCANGDIVGVLKVADYVGMLYGGHLIQYGPTQELVERPHERVRAFLQRNVAMPGAAAGEVPLPTLDSARRGASTQHGIMGSP